MSMGGGEGGMDKQMEYRSENGKRTHTYTHTTTTTAIPWMKEEGGRMICQRPHQLVSQLKIKKKNTVWQVFFFFNVGSENAVKDSII